MYLLNISHPTLQPSPLRTPHALKYHPNYFDVISGPSSVRFAHSALHELMVRILFYFLIVVEIYPTQPSNQVLSTKVHREVPSKLL